MIRTNTSILTKHGSDDFSLWELSMPREKMQEVRQHTPAVEGDMHRIGSLDAEKAVKNGLCLYALNGDDTKEPIADREAYQKHLFNNGLFGMTAEEKQILQYFKQDVTPLFSADEMRSICALALQAGMNNDPAQSAVLDKIIHKAECCLPQAEALSTHEQEQAVEREE